MIDRTLPVLLTGHRGMVGSALVRRFEAAGFERILTASRRDVDLRDQHQVDAWFEENRPAYVVHAAGTVGGIHANRTRPADFLYDNLMIHATVLHAAAQTGVEKLLYLGSSCIYPPRLPAADPRRVPADRPAREDERRLRDRQDRRPDVVLRVPPTTRL